jgi:hypothetical protein
MKNREIMTLSRNSDQSELRYILYVNFNFFKDWQMLLSRKTVEKIRANNRIRKVTRDYFRIRLYIMIE